MGLSILKVSKLSMWIYPMLVSSLARASLKMALTDKFV